MSSFNWLSFIFLFVVIFYSEDTFSFRIGFEIATTIEEVKIFKVKILISYVITSN